MHHFNHVLLHSKAAERSCCHFLHGKTRSTDNLIVLLQEHLMSKSTHHSQPQAASDPFSTAPPPHLNAFPASDRISQPLVASFSTAPPPQLNAFLASGHTSQSLVASSSTAPPPQLYAFLATGHTSQPLVASSLTAPPPRLTAFPASGHISQPLVASSVSSAEEGLPCLCHGAAVLANTTEERDHHIRRSQFISSIATSSSLSLSAVCAGGSYKKTEENTMEVLKLGEQADKLSSMRDYHAAEQCYLHVSPDVYRQFTHRCK
jgi:hypothetical protein